MNNYILIFAEKMKTYIDTNINSFNIILVAITVILTYIGVKLTKKALNSDKNQSRRKLKNLKKSQSQIYDNKSKIVKSVTDNRTNFSRQISEWNLLKESNQKVILVLGEPACGKSHYLIDIFQKEKLCLMFDSNNLLKYLRSDTDRNQLINDLSKANQNYILIFDGIDELEVSYEKQTFVKVSELIQRIRENTNNISFVISSRKDFYEKNNDFSISEEYGIDLLIYQIPQWTSDELLGYGRKLNSALSENENMLQFNSLLDNFNVMDNLVTNPLEMQMVVFLLAKTDIERIRTIKTKFELYDTYIKYVFDEAKTEGNTKNYYLEFLRDSFAMYKSKSKVVYEYNYQNLPILKRNGMLVHYSIFEFAIAKYYYEKIKGKIDLKVDLSLFAQEYKNEIADYISEAIKSLDDVEKNKIIENLMRIYYCTLKKENRKKLIKINPKFECTGLMNSVNELSYSEFFTLKSQIIFRLGRIYFENKDNYSQVEKILDLVYYNDRNVLSGSNIKPEISNDKNYYVALLKRGCAICASFLGYEKIEIDYVNKMLPYKDDYIIDYDLANRSHTMLFYGDVVENCSLFDFKDNKEISCKNSINKRLKRLEVALGKEYPYEDIKKNKKYYFRLFDLATIYTFMANNREMKLKENDKKILRNCFVDFDKASEERRILLHEIKEKILELFD